MKKSIKQLLLLFTVLLFGASNAQVKTNIKLNTPYGNNEAFGKYITINGAKIYYEEYGKGEPLLLIHGNGGSIKSMTNQIDYFKTKHRVIIADSRGQGKSELKTDSLTYIQMARDWDGLVNYLKLDSINIIGWSDGGIIGLEMGISGKSKIKKIVAMGVNLRPDSTALQPWFIKSVKEELVLVKQELQKKDTTQNWNLKKQLLNLMAAQPNIPIEDLSKIKAKVLIMAGDKDIIRGEHSIEIYENIPKAQLCIMPGVTHSAPVSNSELFNTIVNRFLTEPFK